MPSNDTLPRKRMRGRGCFSGDGEDDDGERFVHGRYWEKNKEELASLSIWIRSVPAINFLFQTFGGLTTATIGFFDWFPILPKPFPHTSIPPGEVFHCGP